MDVKKNKNPNTVWMWGGVVFLLLGWVVFFSLRALLAAILGGASYNLFPMLFLMGAFMPLVWIALMLVLSIIYMWLFSTIKHSYCNKAIAITVTVFFALSIYWFVMGWHDGVKFQGLAYLVSFLIIDALLFLITYLLLYLSGKKSNKNFTRLAIILFMFNVIYIAFPWLG